MNLIPIIKFSELQDRAPAHAICKDVDLVVIRYAV